MGFANAAIPSFAAQVAYAPVENFEIFGGADFDPVIEGGTARTAHAAATVGAGVFAEEDDYSRLRFELLGGASVGYSEGVYVPSTSSTSRPQSYDLSGGYVRPFVQVVLATNDGGFVQGGGIRGQVTWASPTYRPLEGVTDSGSFSAAQYGVDIFSLSRYDFGPVALDGVVGLAIAGGDVRIGPPIGFFANLALHLRFDLAGPFE